MKKAPERCLIYLLQFLHRLLLAIRIVYLVETISIKILKNIEEENNSPLPHWMVPTHWRHYDLERGPLIIFSADFQRGIA